jgi:hypothetical protein
VNETQLKQALLEAAELLRGIDIAIPDKVDGELVEFLEQTAKSDWQTRLLHNTLSAQAAERSTKVLKKVGQG